MTSKRTNVLLCMLVVASLFLNFQWLLKLEAQASKVKSLVEQHRKMLEQNQDDLSGLDSFVRSVGSSTIILGQKGIHIGDDHRSIILGRHPVHGEGIFLGLGGLGLDPEGRISLTKDKGINVLASEKPIKFSIGEGKNQFTFMMNPSKAHARFASRDGASVVTFGQNEISMELETNNKELDAGNGSLGISLRPKTGELVLYKSGKGKIRISDAGIEIIGDDETDDGLQILRVGQGKSGRGIELGHTREGTLAIAQGKGVGLSAYNKMLIKGEKSLGVDFKGDVNISANGNINIRSKNGDVRINGKKIHLNDET